MKKSIFLTLIIGILSTTLNSQIIVVNYQPNTLGSCLTTDTVSVTVTNSTTGTVTGLQLAPTMNGFNYISLVAVAGVTVTNPSNTAPVFTIASLAPPASVRIRYYIQAGCTSSSTTIANVLKNSSGVVLNTATTGTINVVFPSVIMTGISNTSNSNQTSSGLLNNLVSEQL